MSIDPSPSRQTVDTSLYRAVLVFTGLNLVVTLTDLPSEIGMYPVPLGQLALALLVGLYVTCVWQARRPMRSWSAFRALVLACWLLGVLHAVLATVAPTDRQGSAYPPFLHVMGATVTGAAAGFGVPAGVALQLSYCLCQYVVRSGTMPPERLLLETTLLLVSQLTSTAFVALVRRAEGEVTRAAGGVLAAQTEQARRAAGSAERVRWDGLIHDRVLAALRVAAEPRPPGADVAEMARSAVAEFSTRPAVDPRDPPCAGVPASTSLDPATVLREAASRAALTASVDVRVAPPACGESLSGDLSPPDAEAWHSAWVAAIDAGREAIANVARHAGVREVSVSGHFSMTRVMLLVRDQGRGFDAAGVHRRTGMTVSMTGRMASVGGQVHVSSEVGAGTSVRLTWHASGPEPRAPLDWPPRTFVPVVVLGLGIMLLNVCLGFVAPPPLRSTLLMQVGAVLICAFSVIIVCAPTAATAVGWLVPAACTLPAVLTWNNVATADTFWSDWHLGALMPITGAVGFRWGTTRAVAAAWFMLLGTMAMDAAAGRPWWGSALGPFPVLLGVAIVGGLSRTGLARGSAAIDESLAHRAALARSRAFTDARDAEIERRRTALQARVLPMLRLVASGARLEPERRRECLLLEAGVRDRLVAPELVDGSVEDVAYQARRQGATVVLASGAAAESDAPAALASAVAQCEAARRVLETVLRAAHPGLLIRGTSGPRPSIVVLGPWDAEARDRVRSMVPTLCSRPVDVLIDEDAAVFRLGPVEGPSRKADGRERPCRRPTLAARRRARACLTKGGSRR
ncbi:MAG: hypothetical protein IPK37_14960 [Austwickia sp.]|jgi:hypothetical protein|nr:MAG: hypothetical protein IPK37_14960 [Austwickia sp.]